ncbi:hypothetical protein H696_02994 [Fonticula alba]|uniref:Uncharacterized protein n=1 Tax=Fonticula alba TaxID=691883 RepID=A0A058Z9P0_FONAL|nr:hypothetical protein H696_02994 [Fonticula alba]KCV70638.1 hypothetical protein H696_02994 [Fonticula alba]|eukprot:XP_009495154.1 hypothetical protein H696_02994 [Fonticula alba]
MLSKRPFDYELAFQVPAQGAALPAPAAPDAAGDASMLIDPHYPHHYPNAARVSGSMIGVPKRCRLVYNAAVPSSPWPGAMDSPDIGMTDHHLSPVLDPLASHAANAFGISTDRHAAFPGSSRAPGTPSRGSPPPRPSTAIAGGRRRTAPSPPPDDDASLGTQEASSTGDSMAGGIVRPATARARVGSASTGAGPSAGGNSNPPGAGGSNGGTRLASEPEHLRCFVPSQPFDSDSFVHEAQGALAQTARKRLNRLSRAHRHSGAPAAGNASPPPRARRSSVDLDMDSVSPVLRSLGFSGGSAPASSPPFSPLSSSPGMGLTAAGAVGACLSCGSRNVQVTAPPTGPVRVPGLGSSSLSASDVGGSDEEIFLHPATGKPLFTQEQARSLVSRAADERERHLREEFAIILQNQMAEQFASFTRFNQDYLDRSMRDRDTSWSYLN